MASSGFRTYSRIKKVREFFKGATKFGLAKHQNVSPLANSRPTFSKVYPGFVSPTRTVPPHIKKPPYAVTGQVAMVKGEPEVKTEKQIQGMREACSLARLILDSVGAKIQVCMTTEEIDRQVHELCVQHGAYPSPLLYKAYPKSCCTSVNNVACHGIPDNRPLHDGDIINVDITVFYKGFHGDVSETFLVGQVDEDGRRLVAVAKQCRDAGVAVCRHGAKFSDIGNSIHELAESSGLDIIPVFGGHGIGEYFHGPPDIFHVANDEDAVMKAGMTFTIEPVVTEGHPEIQILGDGWTAVSVDDSRSAQFEHTILVTEHGANVLTA